MVQCDLLAAMIKQLFVGLLGSVIFCLPLTAEAGWVPDARVTAVAININGEIVVHFDKVVSPNCSGATKKARIRASDAQSGEALSRITSAAIAARLSGRPVVANATDDCVANGYSLLNYITLE